MTIAVSHQYAYFNTDPETQVWGGDKKSKSKILQPPKSYESFARDVLIYDAQRKEY